MLSKFRKLEEEKRIREKRSRKAHLAIGLTLGFFIGYCAKQYIVPKIVETIEKKKMHWDNCCCCADECCIDECCIDECCTDALDKE